MNFGEKGCELMKSSVSTINSGAQSSMIKKTLQVLGVMFGMFLLSLPAFSQGSAGRIVGTITDANGGAITGATVTILDVQRGTSRPLTTDESGAYNAPNLTPGAYKVRAEFKGFKTTERQNIVLEVGQELRVDLTLQPGEQTQTITVTEEVPLVETTNAELGGTLQNEVINDLPLNGRNFENLLDLRPGVTKYVGNSGWTQSSNGLRPHDNFFMVEGINSNDPWMAQSVMNAVMAAGDAGTMLPIDAIDEFKTQQNPRAEYGWKPGAVVNVGIKSGTNSMHGSAYAYGRTTGFDARNYFNPVDATTNSCPTDPKDPTVCTKTPVELEQYGGSLGGAIKKDKLFYFGNFESQRYSVGNPALHAVPITGDTKGVVKPGSDPLSTLIGACVAAGSSLTKLSAQLAGLSDLTSPTPCTPLANYPGIFPLNLGPTKTINTALVSTSRIYSGVGKIDYHINDKHTLSGMYFMSPGSGTFVDDPTIQVDPQWLTVEYARSQVGSVGWTYVANSKWVNSFRFGYSHYYQDFYSPDHNQDAANYSYTNASVPGSVATTYHLYTGVDVSKYPERRGLPLIQWHKGYEFQLGASWPKTVGPDGVWQFSDSVSYLRGNHSFKFGGEVLVNQSTNNVTSNTKGPVRFGDSNGNPVVQNFFTGTLDRARFTSGDFLRHLQNQGYALFVQDDWRVTPRLTVNIGVRYELTTVTKEKNNLIGNFDPVKGPQQVGVGGVSGVYNGDHNNFGPRFGFAWDIGGNGKTVVRGGGSVLYEQGSFDMFNALGNVFGLRTEPTGVRIYTCSIANPPGGVCPAGAENPVTTAVPGGTINVKGVEFTDTLLDPINAAWANNDATHPLYDPTPTCGDGTVTLPNGFTPTPCVILGVDRNLRAPYISTWSLGIQRALTNNLSVDVSYVGNHATKLVGSTDLNQPVPSGGFSAGWGDPAVLGTPANNCINSAPNFGCSPDSALEMAARPYTLNGKFPYLSNILWLSNSNLSNYNSLQVSMTQRATHGLSYVLGYTYSHALGESPDNQSFALPIDSNKVRALYGTTEFDTTHRFTFSTTYAIPGMNAPGQLLKGWSINSIVTLESSTPWGINDVSTDFSGTNETNTEGSNGEQWNFYGNPADFKTTKVFLNTNGGDRGIPYFAGTSNATCLAKAQAIGTLAVASLTDLGCYANGSSVLIPPAYGSVGNTSPNMFRSLPYYNVDLSVTKAFKFKERLTAQFRAEFFNLFNHPTISNPFGGPGGANDFTDPSGAGGASFGLRAQTPDVTSSNPVLGSGGARAMQLGLKLLF
jgi:hypothetical protein